MAIINFTVPKTLEKQITTTIKNKGFASKAEFFRCAAVYFIKLMQEPMTEVDPEVLDSIIVEARKDYAQGKFQSFTDPHQLLKALKA